MLSIGDRMPALTLPDQAGNERALMELLGKRGGVFYFYPRDNTPGCTLETRDFQVSLAAFGARGYTVVGISRDSVTSHANFHAKLKLGFTLLSDESGQVCQAFGVWQEKKNYGKTYMGIVRSTFIVDAEGVVRRVYAKVKAKGHADQVLADLKQAAE
ncbi:MAG: peroxiredoxin [Magnetococcales bacterium]|nr:peroxiredoxin [Magnetococcales bacterium]